MAYRWFAQPAPRSPTQTANLPDLWFTNDVSVMSGYVGQRSREANPRGRQPDACDHLSRYQLPMVPATSGGNLSRCIPPSI